MFRVVTLILLLAIISDTYGIRKRPEDKTQCPKVKPLKDFNLDDMMGKWYVIQYYASSEEALAYRCMEAEFTMSSLLLDITMNFTYSFTDDPLNEQLLGNITWSIPDNTQPAHWIHSEETYEGIYNTFVVDTDYKSWALLLHCAEKSKNPRYLSSFIMSREPVLGVNVISYLRDKLPRYDIDLSYMFEMSQNDCNITLIDAELPPSLLHNRITPSTRRHPMKHHHG